MTKLSSTRILISIGLVLLFFVFLVAILFVTELSLSVWDHLQQKPDWVIWSYIAAVLILVLLFGRIVWRILLPKHKNKRFDTVVRRHKSSNNMEAVARRLEGISHNISAHQKDYHEHSESSSSPQKLDKVEASDQDFSDEVASALNGIDESQLKQWATDFDASPEVAAIRAELEEYGRRKSEQKIYIALFGDISSGKSSLIKALISLDNDQKPLI